MNLIAESMDRMDDDLDGELLAAVGLGDDQDSRAALAEIASTPVPVDLRRRLRSRLDIWLPKSSDPAFALKALQRFISASRSPIALLALFERDDNALPALLKLLSAGERVSNWLVKDPESFDLIRASDGQEASRDTLVDEIVVELEALAAHGDHRDAAMRVLRSVFHRERLRIAFSEFVNHVPPARVSHQLTVLADAIIESATQFIRAELVMRYGEPRRPNGLPGRFAVIGLGSLGGGELNYDTSLDLVFLRDLCEPTDGYINLPADEFFDRLAHGVLRLLGRTKSLDEIGIDKQIEQNDALGQDELPLHDVLVSTNSVYGAGIYDIASSHRPRTDAGSLALTTTAAHRHYQLMGRTWERLLYVKSRCVAGDVSLGREFLALMEPWVYRRYLEPADVEGIHTLARKIARRSEPSLRSSNENASESKHDRIEVVSGPGSLDDIDSIIGLLQLINGVELVQLRVRSTTEAINALQTCKCLSLQEATLLTDHRDLLNRYLHCCQVESSNSNFADCEDPLSMPVQQRERIAWQLGLKDDQGRGNAERLHDSITTALQLNRAAIRALLDDALKNSESVPIETELMLDPDPDESLINTAISRHRLHDVALAMADLQKLADEPVPFLSSRKCRHHLASIAAPLLTEIGRTPDPHATLSTLVEVSNSLGGKAVLWELFRATPPAMHLVVRLCACSPYLARILIHNPGMIDELVDSLLLNRLPTERWLEASSTELCRSAANVDTVIASFKNASILEIGVRDVLGKESLEATHAALASTAECALRRIAEDATRELCERYGDPRDQNGKEIELVMLGLGKLGAREPNYRSDLDVLFLYTGDGNTHRRVGGHRRTTTAANFFTELSQQVSSRVNGSSEGTGLYNLCTSLTLSHSSPLAAMSVDGLRAYFRRGEATLAQRLALCKARAISGTPATRRLIDDMVVELLTATEWYPLIATQIRDQRIALEHSAGDDNLKRAAGGSADVESITQALQLRYAAEYPRLLCPGTTDSLQRFADAGLIDAAMATALITNYRTLREVESKLCLLSTPGRHEIPEDPRMLELLAFLMEQPNGSDIMARCRECRSSNRRMFNQLFQELSR